MKTLGCTKSKIRPGKYGVGVGGSKAGCGGSKLDGSELDGGKVDSNEVEGNEVGKKIQNLSKSKKIVKLDFLTHGAKLAFTKLRQAFLKAPILHHFDPERHIRIETDVSGYAIGGVLSQLTLDDSGRWHPVAFFSRKMIPAETRYETHDGELLAIVEAFKTWRHYLEGSRHEVLVLTNHNNLRQFMDTKSLSSRQVRWAQELSRYHFRIDYCQGKANGAADALSWYPQRNVEKENTLQVENVKILHCLQFSLSNTSFLSLSTSAELSPLHWVFICGTYVLPQLRQLWSNMRTNIAQDSLYIANIGDMRLQLSKLQENDKETKLFRGPTDFLEGWKDVEGVLQYRELPYVLEIIRFKVISCHHNNLLIGHFGIEKIKELVGRKYYWPSLRRDVKSYVQRCDVCLASKAIRHKPYSNLQSLPILAHWWNNLSMDFVTGLPLSSDWKNNNYNPILVIVNPLTKMVHYELVKVTINASRLAEVIIDVVIQHHGLSDSIISDWGAIFTSKFWSSLYSFLEVKQRLSIAFHPQINGQTERQNSIIEVYLRVFVNFKQNDWARVLPMAEFTYNNARNASTSYTPFELNYGYHLWVLYKEDVDPRS